MFSPQNIFAVKVVMIPLTYKIEIECMIIMNPQKP